MIIIKLNSKFKALGKMYRLLSIINQDFGAGYHSQSESILYCDEIKRIKKSINNLENEILF